MPVPMPDQQPAPAMTREEQRRYLQFLHEAIKTDPNIAALRYQSEMDEAATTLDPNISLAALRYNDPRVGPLPHVYVDEYGKFLDDKQTYNDLGATPEEVEAARRNSRFSPEELDVLNTDNALVMPASYPPSGPPDPSRKAWQRPPVKTANQDALMKQLADRLAQK